MKREFLCGNNIDLLKQYPADYFDSIVTDAPYGLGKEPNAQEVLSAWLQHGYLEVKGSGFMGNKWDAFVPQPNFWKEVIRVLKPGGHVLCFFGTRTYDWGVMAMRLAGFEIRDQVQWLYGSGFPKSMNISKAIDKEAGAKREVIAKLEHPTLKDKSKINRQGVNQFHAINSLKDEWDLTAPATDDAKKWDGFGTALKPANEPIVLARKPLEKGLTIAENVLKYGTGALNIDRCRIPYGGEADKKSAVFGCGTNILGGKYVGAKHSSGKTNIPPNDDGRFPANVFLDEHSAFVLDEQTGELASGQPSGYTAGKKHNVFGKYSSVPVTGYGDKGGASRFFYVAKASRSERNLGCEELYWKMEKNSLSPITKAEWNLLSEKDRAKGNIHPTVKPISLMRYAVRLVTPPGGKCGDFYSGSGTTGIACELEDIDFVCVDNVPEYGIISKARHAAWKKIKEKEKKNFCDVQ